MRTSPESTTDAARRVRTANRKTALVLLSIAILFFVGIIATKFMGGGATGIGVVGSVVLLFLVVAIGRNLWGTAGRGRSPKDASPRDPARADARAHRPDGAAIGVPR